MPSEPFKGGIVGCKPPPPPPPQTQISAKIGKDQTLGSGRGKGQGGCRVEEGTASSATSKLSLSALGVFWEGLRHTGKPRLAAAASKPSQGLGVLLLLEGKTKVQKVNISDGGT